MRSGSLSTLLIAALVAGCSAETGAGPSPDATAAESQVPMASPDCFDVPIHGSQSSQSLEQMHKTDSVVVVAVVRGIAEARWNTPDGNRPTRQEFIDTSATLYRPLEVELEGEVRGPKSAIETAIVGGGTLGCDTVTYDSGPDLKVGARHLMFLLPVDDSVGKPSGNFAVFAAWPIGGNDVVETPQDGALPLEAVIQAIKNGPKVTPPPSPGEPTDSPP